MNKKILVFIPGYNCENQIIKVLNQFDRDVTKFFSDIIFVNNRSTDNTEDVVLNYKKKNKNLNIKVLRNLKNYNLGGSHKVAFDYAKENGYEYIIVLHGDNQGNIHDILPYIKTGEYLKYDCLLGSRFEKKSKLIGYSKFRTFGNKVFNIIFSICCKMKITDLGSGLNMYNVNILKDSFYIKFPDKLTFNCCMLFAHSYYKHKLKFFSITWRNDDQISNVKMFSQSIITLKIALRFLFKPKSILNDYRETKIDKYIAEEIQ